MQNDSSRPAEDGAAATQQESHDRTQRPRQRASSRRAFTPATLDELIERVGDRRVITPDGCWLFTGYHGHHGYSLVSVAGASRRLHRLACALANGANDSGDWFACHRCGVTGCWNPAHLYVGDNNTNMRDAGRVVLRDHHETVIAMREAGARLVDIAAAIGVSVTAVSRYLRRVRYRPLTAGAAAAGKPPGRPLIAVQPSAPARRSDAA